MTQNEVRNAQGAVEIALKRMGTGNSGASIEANLSKRTKSDPGAAQFAVGDELAIPADSKTLFKNVFNSNELYGVVAPCKSAEGTIGAKTLYFSALDRSVAEYGEDMLPTGAITYAKTDDVHDVYDAVSVCPNDLDVWKAIKGKTLKVASINEVKAARYNRDGQIVGTRTRKVPVFQFA
jgi:hypothetical protein